MAIQKLQPMLSAVASKLDGDLSLEAMAQRAGLSPFHLHRLFRATAGETPKRFVLRLRLGRAAAMLLCGDDPVLTIALDCGFGSHEVFTRAFRRRFGMSPQEYRKRGFSAPVNRHAASAHRAWTEQIAPCLGFYRASEKPKEDEVTYSITKKELTPQPALAMTRRVKQSEIAQALGEMYGRIFAYAQQSGAAIAGAPFARYLEMGPGLMTMEAGLPVAATVAPSSDGQITPTTLPGGLAIFTTHAGVYERLPDAHAALQIWLGEQGITPSGAPWESYVTDPSNYPDPKDWKTEVYCPING
jgi:AraC family transcriptional regulator